MTDLVHEIQPELAHLLSKAQPILEQYGYAGLFVSSFAEGVGVPLPAQTLLIAAAVLASKGDFQIALVAAIALAGSLTGTCAGYLIGRTGGRALLLRCRFPAEKLEQVESFMTRRGVLVVVVSRFMEGFRQTVPIVAGSLEMGWWRFFLATTAGSAAWVAVWGLGVYSVSEHSRGILTQLHRVSTTGWWALGLLGLSSFGYYLLRRLRR